MFSFYVLAFSGNSVKRPMSDGRKRHVHHHACLWQASACTTLATKVRRVTAAAICGKDTS
jgi:hypothetical protein